MKSRLLMMMFATLIATSAVHAQNVTTPVLSVIDSSPDAKAFHLVSQDPKKTVIQFDELPHEMRGSYAASLPDGTAGVSKKASQYFQLSVNPAFQLITISVLVDLRLWSSGAMIAGPYTIFDLELQGNGADWGNRHFHLIGPGDVDRQVDSFIANMGDPLAQEWALGIEMEAEARGHSIPWAPASGGFSTDAIYLVLYTNQIAPIPEPSSFAMLTAGLALLGMAARRRRAPRRN